MTPLLPALIALLALIIVGIAYDWLTTAWLRRWLKPPPLSPSPNAPAAPEATPPITFFRPIKPAVPRLAELLADFLRAVAPGDQILIGVYPSDLASQSQIAAVLSEFPHLDSTLILCTRSEAENPKINKLLQLAPHARHQHWILLDSELAHIADFLPAFRREWQAADFPVLSAPYRFTRLTLSTLPVLATLLPGLAVLHRFGKIQNTLGACLALTRSHLAELGGWSTLGRYLAEDYQIGHRLARRGRAVAYSRAVCELENDPATASSTFWQMHRVHLTYRICQPWGFAGSLLVLTPFWTLCLLATADARIASAAFLVAAASRIFAIQQRTRITAWPASLWKIALLFPVSSLLEIFFWFLAWLPLPVHWAGRRWQITPQGQLHPLKNA